MLRTTTIPTEVGKKHVNIIFQCLQNDVFFQGDIGLRDPLTCSHRNSSVTQLTLSTMIPRRGCKSRGGSRLRPSHNTALVWIHMHATKYDPTHASSFHPFTFFHYCHRKRKRGFRYRCEWPSAMVFHTWWPVTSEAVLISDVFAPEPVQH